MNRPWAYDNNTPSAAAEYGSLLRKQLKDTFERALKSLARDGVLVCEEFYRIVSPLSIDNLKCLEAIHAEAQKPNSCLDPELVSSLLESDSNNLFFSLWNGRATDTQIQAIENYKLYLRQCVYGFFIGGDVLPSKDIDWISTAGKFFSSYKYRKKYAELDKKLRESLFGGIYFWKEYQYSIIDPEKAATYRSEDCREIISRLTQKMIEYMDGQMCKHSIYFYKEDLPDLIEGKFIGEIRYGSKLPLTYFKSAQDIHNQIKTQYAADV